MENYFLPYMNVTENETIKASEYAVFPIDLSWTLDYCMGQDAKYILRKKAILFALEQLEDELLAKSRKKNKRNYFEEVDQEVNGLPVLNKSDFSWTLDCPTILQ